MILCDVENKIYNSQKIRALKCDHPSWGCKRITAWLRRREHMKANHKRVLRLMKADGLLVPKNLRLRAARRNSSTEKAKPKTIEPNRFWGDRHDQDHAPTVRLGLYLHIVIDWGDKKLLAAHLSRTGRSQDWITALEQAAASEFPMGIRDLPAGCDGPNWSATTDRSLLPPHSAVLARHLESIRSSQATAIPREMPIRNG